MNTRHTNPVSAKGVTGFLLWVGGAYIFRVYDKEGAFIDRNIRHFDLEVSIVSNDAYFYDIVGDDAYLHDPECENFHGCIDHDPETIGVPL